MPNFFILITLLFLSACSVFRPNYCRQDGARDLGRQDALSWSGKSNYNKGSSCDYDDYNGTNFQRDYTDGYNLALRENCTDAKFRESAKSDAAEGLVDLPNLKKFQLCSDAGVAFSKIEKSYRNTFKREFCTEYNARELAKKHTESSNPNQSDKFKQFCGDNNLAQAYYQEYLKRFESVVRSKASVDALSGASQNTLFIAENIKDSGAQKRFQDIYQQAYANAYFEDFQKKVIVQADSDAKAYLPSNADFITTSRGSADQKQMLKVAYEKKYQESLKESCSLSTVMMLAQSDAKAGSPIESGMSKLGVCPVTQGAQGALSVYAKSYNSEKEAILLKQENERLMQEKKKLEEQNKQLSQGSLSSPHFFTFEGYSFASQCQVVTPRLVKVALINRSSTAYRLRYYSQLKIQFFNQAQALLGEENVYFREEASPINSGQRKLKNIKMDDFFKSFMKDAVYCRAILNS